MTSCYSAAAASSSSLVVLGEAGDNPLAFWEQIQWDFDDCGEQHQRHIKDVDHNNFASARGNIQNKVENYVKDEHGDTLSSSSNHSDNIVSTSPSYIKENAAISSCQFKIPSFELEIERNPYSVTLWVLYLDAMKSASTKDRFVIYERAVKVLPRSYKLWYRYLKVNFLSLYIYISFFYPSVVHISDIFITFYISPFLCVYFCFLFFFK